SCLRGDLRTSSRHAARTKATPFAHLLREPLRNDVQVHEHRHVSGCSRRRSGNCLHHWTARRECPLELSQAPWNTLCCSGCFSWGRAISCSSTRTSSNPEVHPRSCRDGGTCIRHEHIRSRAAARDGIDGGSRSSATNGRVRDSHRL